MSQHPSDQKPWLFKPGQSGNPGGRKKGLERRVREACGEDGELLIDMLVAIAEDETARKADRIDAIGLLFDRGWGRAPLAVDLRVHQDGREQLAELPLEDLQALVVAGRAIMAQQASPADGEVRALPERSPSSPEAKG
jgi:hypothetical protein